MLDIVKYGWLYYICYIQMEVPFHFKPTDQSRQLVAICCAKHIIHKQSEPLQLKACTLRFMHSPMFFFYTFGPTVLETGELPNVCLSL